MVMWKVAKLGRNGTWSADLERLVKENHKSLCVVFERKMSVLSEMQVPSLFPSHVFSFFTLAAEKYST